MNTSEPINEVEFVQARLRELGWYDVGPVDGNLSDKTKDEIVAFRRREGLPLEDATGVLLIDDALIEALRTARPKQKPLAQVTATIADIAPKVEAVAANSASIRTAWWTKVWGYVTGIPSVVLSVAIAVINQFDPALQAIAPLRAAFSEVPTWAWIGFFGAICLFLGINAHRMQSQSQVAENKLVEGFQAGTVRSDPGVTT